MARDLTQLEYENYKILVLHLEDDRPMRVMCSWADRFTTLFNAYEKLKNQKTGGE